MENATTNGAGGSVHFGTSPLTLNQLLAQQLYATHFTSNAATSTQPPPPQPVGTAPEAAVSVLGGASRTSIDQRASESGVRDSEPGSVGSGHLSGAHTPLSPQADGAAATAAAVSSALPRGPLDHFSAPATTGSFSAFTPGMSELSRGSTNATPNLVGGSVAGATAVGGDTTSAVVSPNLDEASQSLRAFPHGESAEGEHDGDDDEEDGTFARHPGTAGSRHGSTGGNVGKFSLAGPNAGVAGSRAAAAVAAAAAAAATVSGGSLTSRSPRLSSTPRSLFASAQNPTVAGAGGSTGSPGTALDTSPPSCPLLPPSISTSPASASALASLTARPATSLALGASPPSASDLGTRGAVFGTPLAATATPPARTHLHSPAQGAVIAGGVTSVVYGASAMAMAPSPIATGPLPTASISTTPGNSPRPSPLTLTQKQHQQQALARQQALLQQQFLLQQQQQQQFQQYQLHAQRMPPPQPQPFLGTSPSQSSSSSVSVSGRDGVGDAPFAIDVAGTTPQTSAPQGGTLSSIAHGGSNDREPAASDGVADPAPPAESQHPSSHTPKNHVDPLDAENLVHLLDSLSDPVPPAPINQSAAPEPVDHHHSSGLPHRATTPTGMPAESSQAARFLSVRQSHSLPSPLGSCASAASTTVSATAAALAPGTTGSHGPMGISSSTPSARSSRTNSTPHTPTTPTLSGRSFVPPPPGPVVEVYSPDFKYLLSIPKQQVVHHPHPALGVSRLVLCRNYDPSGVRGCGKGAGCKFVHADITNAGRCSIHVNYAYRSLDVCAYPRLAAGEVLEVLAPNERPPCEPIPSDHILVTQGSKAWFDHHRRQALGSSPSLDHLAPTGGSFSSPTNGNNEASGAGTITTPTGRSPRSASGSGRGHSGPLSHCAHYYFNRICNRGERCHFIHAVHVDPTVTKDFKRAPAPTTVAPIIKRGHGSGRSQRQAPPPPPPPPQAATPAANSPTAGTPTLRADAQAYKAQAPSQQQQLPPPPLPPATTLSAAAGIFAPASNAGRTSTGSANMPQLHNGVGSGAGAAPLNGVPVAPIGSSPVSGLAPNSVSGVAQPPPPPPPPLTQQGAQAFVYYHAMPGTALYGGPPSPHSLSSSSRTVPPMPTSGSPTMPQNAPFAASSGAPAFVPVGATASGLPSAAGLYAPTGAGLSPTSMTTSQGYFLMVPGAVGMGTQTPSVLPCGSPFTPTALELSPMQGSTNPPSMNSSVVGPLDWSFYGELETTPAWPHTPTSPY